MSYVSDLKQHISKDQLAELRKTRTDQELAGRFGVTINAIRILAKEYELPSRKQLTSPKYRDKELNKRAPQFDAPILQVDIPSGQVLIDRLSDY